MEIALMIVCPILLIILITHSIITGKDLNKKNKEIETLKKDYEIIEADARMYKSQASSIRYHMEQLMLAIQLFEGDVVRGNQSGDLYTVIQIDKTDRSRGNYNFDKLIVKDIKGKLINTAVPYVTLVERGNNLNN